MWEHVPGVNVTADALEETQQWRQGGEEAEEAGVVGVALRRVVPVARVQTAEQCDVLRPRSAYTTSAAVLNGTYTSGVCERAVDVAEEEVPKLDREDASE